MNKNFTNLFKNFNRAVVVSHDAGGAEVLSRIVKQTKIKKHFFLSGPAKKIFKVSNENNFTNIYERIDKSDLCICSTSMDNDTYYDAFQYAKEKGVYTIVVLDHWNFYKDRIQSTKKDHLPDQIVVFDNDAKKIVRKLFSRLKIVVLQNPYLHEILKDIVKTKYNKNKNKLKILYCTEAIKKRVSTSKQSYDYYKYNEFEALEFFLKYVQLLSQKEIEITVRVHPNEEINKYDNIINKYRSLNIVVNRKSALTDQIAFNDIIVGCETYPMAIGVAANKRVISSIPPNGKPCALPLKKIEYFKNLIFSKPISFNQVGNFDNWPKKIIFSKKEVIRKKTKKEIIREFEIEEWGNLLKKAKKIKNINIDKVDQLQNSEEIIPYFYRDNFFINTYRSVNKKHTNLYRNILSKYLSDRSTIVELGAGYGLKIFSLAKSKKFSKNNLICAEFTKSGQSIMKLLKQSVKNKVKIGFNDFRNCSVSENLVPKKSIIFTSFSLQYVRFVDEKLLNFFTNLDPKVIIHFEPCYEHFSTENTYDMMCRRYIDINDYNKNLFSSIINYQEKGKCKILNVQKKVLSYNPFLPISIIEWTPTNK